MKRPLLLLCIVLVFSCRNEKLTTYDQMRSDSLLSESFTENELKDLSVIIDFFEGVLCDDFNNGNKENISSCYDKFHVKNKAQYDLGSYLKFIDIESQRGMYRKIDSTTLFQIWRRGRCYPDTLKTPEHLGIRAFDGKYYEFLERTGKKDLLFKEYAYGIYAANDIGAPGNIASLIMNNGLYNKEDIKIRLLYSIHYLSINENLDYREKKPCL